MLGPPPIFFLIYPLFSGIIKLVGYTFVPEVLKRVHTLFKFEVIYMTDE